MSAVPRDVDPGRYRDIWVYVEHDGGRAAPVSWELIGAARGLAGRLGEAVGAVLLGPDAAALTGEVFARGADRAYLVEDPVLSPYRAETHARALARLIEAHRPAAVLLGATALGRELSGLVATSVAGGLTADVTELSVDPDKRLLEATRPTFGGKQLATIVCERWRPQMATVRPGVLGPPPAEPGRSGTVIREAAGIDPDTLATEVVEVLSGREDDAVGLERAQVVVAGGRGLGDAANFALLRELAEVTGGVVAGSRAAVEAGWIDREAQVGQTGRTVRPRLYFAIGISGAIQHLVGMRDAGVVVAINRDPKAPIFQEADLGVVGDLRAVVPALSEALRVRLGRRGSRGDGLRTTSK